MKAGPLKRLIKELDSLPLNHRSLEIIKGALRKTYPDQDTTFAPAASREGSHKQNPAVTDLSSQNHLKALTGGKLLEHETFTIDLDRAKRTGIPEIIFTQNKSINHVSQIVSSLAKSGHKDLLLSRVTAECYTHLKKLESKLSIKFVYHELGKVLYTQAFKEHMQKTHRHLRAHTTSVITAGSSDIGVAEEAAVILECMGARVERIYDVGVAGLNRLFNHLDAINKTQLALVIAGMDGVLPSVLGGLVPIPVIAIPSSVGYGAHLGGLASLLTMLNSCAPGVTVLNIDNGLGGAALALKILNTFTTR
ncbi:nicotinic acid adenine dinucleotide carboxylase/hydrolase [Spirochaetota bacterium]|nr:nicotinic acid adenine dinucleotide carboxylase/hydrolase [Spirochaetota bacterium]